MTIFKPKLKLLMFCCIALNSPLYAAYSYQPNHFDLIGGIGVATLNAENSQLRVTRSEVDTLVQKNKNNWQIFASHLGVGYVHYFKSANMDANHVHWFPKIEPELNAYHLNASVIEGEVWRFNNAAFNQLTFKMPIRSTRLMFDTALTVVAYKKLSLFVIGGIGQAWNRASYSDRQNDTAPCSNQNINLTSKTSRQFAWEVGTGIELAINHRFSASLQYLYADLGKMRASSYASSGSIASPLISSPGFKVKARTVLLGLHIAV